MEPRQQVEALREQIRMTLPQVIFLDEQIIALKEEIRAIPDPAKELTKKVIKYVIHYSHLKDQIASWRKEIKTIMREHYLDLTLN